MHKHIMSCRHFFYYTPDSKEPFSIKWQVEEKAVEVQTVQSGRISQMNHAINYSMMNSWNSRAGYIDLNFNHGRLLKTMEQNSTKSEILNGSSLSFTKSSSRYLKLVYYVLEFWSMYDRPYKWIEPSLYKQLIVLLSHLLQAKGRLNGVEEN